jgi:hypothetical protein
MTKTQEQVIRFVEACEKYGFTWESTKHVVRIMKRLPPCNKDAFTEADMMAPSVLSLVPLKGGSVWGTDGGSIGGWSALQSGNFVMNKSGEGSRFTTALSRYKK